MKALLIAWITVCICTYTALGQTKKDAAKLKKDSLQLKADVEAIRTGKSANTKGKKSIVQSETPANTKVDTTALKAGLPRPTPSSPNNPNPHEPVPSTVNAEPPATPQRHLPAPFVIPVNQKDGSE